MQLPVSPFALAAFGGLWTDLATIVVVIALACRAMPAHQRLVGVALGAGAAAAAQIVVALMSGRMQEPAFLRIGGASALIVLAALLVSSARPRAKAELYTDSLSLRMHLAYVRMIAVCAAAGFVSSLDRIAALGAAARAQPVNLALGLGLLMPATMIAGALACALIGRVPALIWAGGALLGWFAGIMLVSDPDLMRLLAARATHYVTIDPIMPIGFVPVARLHYSGAVLGALAVLLLGLLAGRRGSSRQSSPG